jgi:hypothetical protein
MVCRGHTDTQPVQWAAKSSGSRPGRFFTSARSLLTRTKTSTTRIVHNSRVPEPPYLPIQHSHPSRIDQLGRARVNQQKGSALLQLPTEIRIMMYERLLCTHTIQLNLEYAPHLTPGQFQWHFWHRLFLWPIFNGKRGDLDFWLGLWQPTTASREEPSIGTPDQLQMYEEHLQRFKQLREEEPKIAIAILRTCRKV